MGPDDLTPTLLGRAPGCKNLIERVPTVFRYIRGGKGYEWRFETDEAGFKRLALFKTPVRTSDEFPDTFEVPASIPIGNFLNALYNYLREHFAKNGLGGLEMDISFPLPAYFSDSVADEFRKIISTSSFGNHRFNVHQTQPETVAIYALSSQTEGEFSVSKSYLRMVMKN